MPAAVVASSVNEQATGGTNTCTTPAGTASGDLLLAFVTHHTSTPPSAPANWSVGGQAPPPATQTVSTSAFYRHLSAAPAASYGFPIGATTSPSTVILVRISGHDAATPLLADPLDATETTGALATTTAEASVTTPENDVLMVSGMAINGVAQNISPIPAQYTEVSRSTGTGKRLVVGQEFRAAAGATGTRTWTTGGANTVWAGVRLHVKSAASAAVRSAGLSGSGSLTAFPSTVTATQPAGLGGSGTLSTTQRLGFDRTAVLSGSGTLAATGKQGFTRAAALSGNGLLEGAPVPGQLLAALLSGSGELQAGALGFAAALLNSSGTLVAFPQDPAVFMSVSLSSSGTLAALAKAKLIKSAAVSGSGTLVAFGLITPRAAPLSGSGYLSTWGQNLARIGTVVPVTFRLGGTLPVAIYLGNALVWRP